MSTTQPGRTTGRLSPLALALLVLAVLFGTTGGAVAGGLITGAQIKNGSVTGIDLKNGSVTGADIRNDSLAAVDIKDEPRVYGASAGYGSTGYLDDFTANSFTPIVSKSFSVPRAGYLFITGNVYAEADNSLGADGYLPYTLRLDGNTVTNHSVLDTSTTNFSEDGSISVVLPVSAGAHTVALVARDDASGSFIRERSVSVVWSPTGSKSGSAFTPRAGHPRIANR